MNVLIYIIPSIRGCGRTGTQFPRIAASKYARSVISNQIVRKMLPKKLCLRNNLFLRWALFSSSPGGRGPTRKNTFVKLIKKIFLLPGLNIFRFQKFCVSLVNFLAAVALQIGQGQDINFDLIFSELLCSGSNKFPSMSRSSITCLGESGNIGKVQQIINQTKEEPKIVITFSPHLCIT